MIQQGERHDGYRQDSTRLGDAKQVDANLGDANQGDRKQVDGGPLTPSQVRLLKIAVIAMGLMILAGLAAVIGRVIYLASGTQKQATRVASVPGVPSLAVGRGASALRLALPPQSVVRHLALSGDRLAVHFESPAGAGIAVLDATTGAMLSRIELVPEVPH